MAGERDRYLEKLHAVITYRSTDSHISPVLSFLHDPENEVSFSIARIKFRSYLLLVSENGRNFLVRHKDVQN
jgi:hypothetical protein